MVVSEKKIELMPNMHSIGFYYHIYREISNHILLYMFLLNIRTSQTSHKWINSGVYVWSSYLSPKMSEIVRVKHIFLTSWWRHQMETFSALLALCEGNPPATFGFPSQRPVTRSFGVLFDPRLNKRLSKQPRRRWFERPSSSSWRHCNVSTHRSQRRARKWVIKVSISK